MVEQGKISLCFGFTIIKTYRPPINLDLKDGYTPISTNTHIEKKILLLDVDLVKGFDKSHGLPVE